MSLLCIKSQPIHLKFWSGSSPFSTFGLVEGNFPLAENIVPIFSDKKKSKNGLTLSYFSFLDKINIGLNNAPSLGHIEYKSDAPVNICVKK